MKCQIWSLKSRVWNFYFISEKWDLYFLMINGDFISWNISLLYHSASKCSKFRSENSLSSSFAHSYFHQWWKYESSLIIVRIDITWFIRRQNDCRFLRHFLWTGKNRPLSATSLTMDFWIVFFFLRNFCFRPKLLIWSSSLTISSSRRKWNDCINETAVRKSETTSCTNDNFME